ncbi:Hypothetical predicted protein [Pelobates cultripes]|uniref:Uncharacterized protein n=1 Tax=Pelobates cultripes TaxID=61616 RepID=A0AAD1R261_PELCU|nr:Hypothetical predicted protein [Pelobates cultripes]
MEVLPNAFQYQCQPPVYDIMQYPGSLQNAKNSYVVLLLIYKILLEIKNVQRYQPPGDRAQ